MTPRIKSPAAYLENYTRHPHQTACLGSVAASPAIHPDAAEGRAMTGPRRLFRIPASPAGRSDRDIFTAKSLRGSADGCQCTFCGERVPEWVESPTEKRYNQEVQTT